jgi:AmiR/NasT family two-component response regulator
VYSETAGAYDERSEDLLRRFADQAAIFVRNVHTAQSAQRIGDELKETLRTRDVIATARGMMMARKGIDSERAYRQLLWLARRTRIPLSELAQRMVASPVHPNPPQHR